MVLANHGRYVRQRVLIKRRERGRKPAYKGTEVIGIGAYGKCGNMTLML
jgi:hypothetical protein